MLGAAVRTEWLDNDYYDQLGVPDTASDTGIPAAYRRLARRLHPAGAGPDKGRCHLH
jgi:DnaJ-class molecular chaperone